MRSPTSRSIVAPCRHLPSTRHNMSCSWSAASISAAGIDDGVVEQIHFPRPQVLVSRGAPPFPTETTEHLIALAGQPSRYASSVAIRNSWKAGLLYIVTHHRRT